MTVLFAEPIRHVILDRDGVLNSEAPGGGWITRTEDWAWEPGALEGLRLLSDAGLRISVATNQSGVGRGVMTRDELQRVNDHMLAEVARAGARIDEVVFCPHAPGDDCQCRKPAPGLMLSLLRSSGIPAEQTLLVGDALRDLQAAKSAGIRAVLVRTGKGRSTERDPARPAVRVFENLRDAAAAIVDG